MAVDIRVLLDTGMSPREVEKLVAAEHREQVRRECEAGIWKCPLCGGPMRLSEDEELAALAVVVCAGDCRGGWSRIGTSPTKGGR